MRRFLLLALLLSPFTPRTADADVVDVPCVRDNTLFEDADGDTSNGAGPAVFAGRNGQNRTRRGALAFDLASAVPPESRIDSVLLVLHVSSAPDSTARPYSIYRLSRSWGEGQSSSAGGTGAPATAGDATWLHAFYPTLSWTDPGGDFDPVMSATQICGDGACTWSGPGLVADVVRWLLDPANNHGWLLRGDESGVRTVRRFDSREASLPADRPTLTIHFSRLVPVESTPQTWGSLKASYR